MLRHLGYKVTALNDSQDALRLFSADPSQFDLVMTDQTMPFMTGEDLGKVLMNIRPDIPVILCTGYSDLISSEKATAMGFRGFIMKPFTLREGAELVRSVLDQKEPSNLRERERERERERDKKLTPFQSEISKFGVEKFQFFVIEAENLRLSEYYQRDQPSSGPFFTTIS